MRRSIVALFVALVLSSAAQAVPTRYYSRQTLVNVAPAAAAPAPVPQQCPAVTIGHAVPYSGLVKNFGNIGSASSASDAAGVCNSYIASNKLSGSFECGWYVRNSANTVSMVQVTSAGFSATNGDYYASYCPSK